VELCLASAVAVPRARGTKAASGTSSWP